MGMTAKYRRISEAELQEILLGDVRKKWRLISGEGGRKIDLEHLDSEFRIKHADELKFLCAQYAGSGGLWSEDIKDKATSIGLSEADVDRETKQRGLHLALYLDKHVPVELHHLLTGEKLILDDIPTASNLLAIAVRGENFVPDTGRIPSEQVRYIKPARVKEVATALAGTTYSDLAEKNGFGPENEFMESVLDMFKQFYLKASEEQDVVLQIFG